MLVLKIILGVVAFLAASVVALIAYAVAREPKPLTGAALAASSEAQAYSQGEARSLAARELNARSRDFDIREPAMRVHSFEIGSEGPPILLIHGGGSSAVTWLQLLTELRGRHLFVVDRPGCGLTDGFDYTGVDLRRHGAAFVGSVLDALGLERPVIVGNSMGGLWAIYYALEHPERVAGLVLMGTPAVTLGTGVPKPLRMMALPGIGQLMMLHKPSAETARDRLAVLLGHHAMEQIPPDLFEVSQLAADIPGAGRSFRTLARAASADGVAPTTAEVASLKPPVLWVWGDADFFGDSGFPARARQTLSKSEVVVLPGAGHCPWVDDPRAAGRAVQAFLDANESSSQASAAR